MDLQHAKTLVASEATREISGLRPKNGAVIVVQMDDPRNGAHQAPGRWSTGGKW